MTVTDLMRMTALATLVVTSATSGATAQTTEADPHRLNAILAQATPGQAQVCNPLSRVRRLPRLRGRNASLAGCRRPVRPVPRSRVDQ